MSVFMYLCSSEEKIYNSADFDKTCTINDNYAVIIDIGEGGWKKIWNILMMVKIKGLSMYSMSPYKCPKQI